MKLGFLTAPLPDLPLEDVAAWAGENGTYILSNEAGFDPNVGGRGNWTLLKEAR